MASATPGAAAAASSNLKMESTSSSGSNTLDDATIDLATAHVHETIRSLLADEVPDLADNHGHKVLADPYLYISYESFKSYLNFIFGTWFGVAVSFYHLLKLQISEYGYLEFIILTLMLLLELDDFLALVFFSAMVSGVLTMGVITCLLVKLPFVENIFGIYSRVNGGVSVTNSCKHL
jgi:hypothetical protein